MCALCVSARLGTLNRKPVDRPLVGLFGDSLEWATGAPKGLACEMDRLADYEAKMYRGLTPAKLIPSSVLALNDYLVRKGSGLFQSTQKKFRDDSRMSAQDTSTQSCRDARRFELERRH